MPQNWWFQQFQAIKICPAIPWSWLCASCCSGVRAFLSRCSARRSSRTIWMCNGKACGKSPAMPRSAKHSFFPCLLFEKSLLCRWYPKFIQILFRKRVIITRFLHLWQKNQTSNPPRFTLERAWCSAVPSASWGTWGRPPLPALASGASSLERCFSSEC